MSEHEPNARPTEDSDVGKRPSDGGAAPDAEAGGRSVGPGEDEGQQLSIADKPDIIIRGGSDAGGDVPPVEK